LCIDSPCSPKFIPRLSSASTHSRSRWKSIPVGANRPSSSFIAIPPTVLYGVEAMKPKAISYIRWSSKAQSDGDSLERQTKMAKKWCEDHGVELDKTIRDDATSAWTGDNRLLGKLGKFLEDIEQGKIPKGTYLLLENADRLSREKIRDALTLVWKIVDAGVTIVTLIDGKEFNSKNVGDLELMLSLTISFCLSHLESEKKSYRLKETWITKRADARTGTSLTAMVPFWLSIKDGQIALNKKAELVRQIVNYSIAGIGTQTIVQKLNHDKIPSPQGKTWSTTTISRLIRSRSLIGEFQPCNRDDV